MAAHKNLGRIRPIAAYELIADQIQRAIHMGLLVPGDRLPPERALAQQLGVARMTLREAIRVLAHEGRITVRRGARGGIWIKAQDVTKRELLRLAADTDRAIEDVYEFREVVERVSARLAAQRAQPKDVRKLRQFTRDMKNILTAHFKRPLASHVPEFLALDSQFHAEIARISGNHFISEAVELALAARYAPFGAVFRALTADANDNHDDIVDAIAAGEDARAERIMATHVRDARSSLMSGLSDHVRKGSGR